MLFADLVGFTTLSEYLDPEQVKRLIDGCFALLVEDIAAFGGSVDKLLGDAIVALFGVPVAHEDDAERAVRAALRMQDTIAAFAASRVESGLGSSLRMRVGINTGVALVGTVAGTDHTAMGDVVNIASRLQTLAPAGGVLVGDATYRLTSSSVTYDAAGDLAAKGREGAVPAWLALATASAPGQRRGRLDSVMVGRSTELALALAAYEFAIANSQAALVAIDGEGGVGKSRLVDEFVAAIRDREQPLVLEGSAVPYGESNVWWPIASAFVQRFELDQATPVEQVRELARSHGSQLLGAGNIDLLDEFTEAWLHLLGYPSLLNALEPSAAREDLTRAITTMLALQLQDRPVVLSIRDLHWADPAVLALCEHLLVAAARRPFVLITTNRPDAELIWPPLSSRAAVIRLPLEPLGPKAAAELCRAILGADVDDATIRTIYERSGGNPLFLEELAVLVADGGALTMLPESLRAVVAARLDQLPSDQRALLDNAAVLGPSGQVLALERMSEQLNQHFTPEALSALVDAGLLELDGRRWSFKSDSVREVAYQTLTKAVRAARHVGISRAMQSKNYSPDDVAHHLASAAELANELGHIAGVPPNIRTVAVQALDAASLRASEHGNLRQVVRYSTRALDLFDRAIEMETPGRRAQLELRRVAALVDLRQIERAQSEAEEILGQAIASKDRAAEAGARRYLGVISQTQGDLSTARRELGQAVELLRKDGNQALLADALRARGFVELFGGDLADAEWHFGEAEGLYRDLDDRRGLGWIEQHRAWMSFLRGDMKVAEAHLHSAADMLHELGDRAGVGWAFGLLAFVQFYDMRFAEAEKLANLVLSEARERGDEWGEGMMMSLTAALKLWTGHLDEAATLAEQARTKFKKLGDGYGQVQALAVLGRAQVALGNANATRTVESLVSQSGLFGSAAFQYLAAAGIAMHAGHGSKAVALAEEAIARTGEFHADASEARAVRAIALAQIGDYDQARTELAQISTAFEVHPFPRAALSLVALLQDSPSEALAAANDVLNEVGHTYLDAVLAGIAGGGAAALLGDANEADRWLTEAIAVATGVGDVVATGLALQAYEAILGSRHPGGGGDPGAVGGGWRSVIQALPRRQLELSTQPE